MQTIAPLWLWATFVGIVLVSLFIDFVVLKKQGSHDIGVKEALNWPVLVGSKRQYRLHRAGQHKVAGVFDRLPD